MFGSTSPFGASTSSPFGSSPSTNPFGTTVSSNPFGASQTTNLFGAKPFGSPTFGQTGSSLFGGTATGVFGVTQASPLVSSTPAFGSSSTPAFGTTSSPFGSGTSIFGQKPGTSFGGFGSTSGQTNPFGSTSFGQTQPAFGSQPFGSTTSTLFGSSTPAFGSTPSPAFGSSTPAFGASSTPAFGASSTPAFGASSTPAFGATALFGSGTSVFGQSTPAFAATSTPAFGSTSVFGSGSAASPFSVQNAPAFSSTPPLTFGSAGTPFSGQRGGSRAVPYAVTNDADAGVSGQIGKLMTISAMPAYKNKSPEELRWEDYQAGDKGGPSTVGQLPATGIFGQATSPSPFSISTSSAFSQPSTPNPFAASNSNIFTPKPSSVPAFGTPNTSSVFGSGSAFATPQSPFGSASTTPFSTGTTSPFGLSSTISSFTPGSSSAFGSAFGSSTSGAFGSTNPMFSSTPAFASSSPFAGGSSSFALSNPFGGSQASGSLFPTAQSFGTSTPAFGNSAPTFGSNIFGSTSSSLFQPTKPAGLGQTMPSTFGGFQSSSPGQTTGAFGFAGLGQSQLAMSTPFAVSPPTGFGQNYFTQQAVTNVPVSNPFGTLPAMPHISIERSGGTGPSVQYGISSMPVSDKPTQIRTTSLLTPRHITQRSKIRMQARRYHPKKDSPKVSFFSDSEETSNIPKADALFVPRENPRALFIRQPDRLPITHANANLNAEEVATPVKRDGKQIIAEQFDPKELATDERANFMEEPDSPLDGCPSPSFEGAGMHNNSLLSKSTEKAPSSKCFLKENGFHSEYNFRGNGYISIAGHRAGEAAIAYEHGADIEALMPKLRHSEYYVAPRIQELAAKERAEPGYCRKVRDFVVGRCGYGFVKFLGETDVRGLDLESIIQFNKCEVLVYMDESKKPPIGVGLNKPAEITLLNVKCVDKKTGQDYLEGPEVDKFEKRLKRKTEDQGAEFISYNAAKGEWRFRVEHFSRYAFSEVENACLLATGLMGISMWPLFPGSCGFSPVEFSKWEKNHIDAGGCIKELHGP
eukprot:c28918_g1_i2 orf=482-3577(-)